MSDTQPLVSVLLPVRNGAETIGAVAESVLASKHGEIELLISDNASTDDTEAAARELSRADSRVRYHRHPENVGILNNFMGLLRMARGSYTRWISDADRLEPDYVDRCLDAFAADPRVILVTTGMAYLTADGQLQSEEYTGTGLGSDDPADRGVEMMRLLNESYRQLDPLYAMMRRDAVLSIPRRNMLREDQIFAVKLALRGPWAHVPEVLAMREWHTGATTSQARQLSVPRWQAYFADSLQVAELLRVVRDAELNEPQRQRLRAAAYRLYVRRQERMLRHRTGRLLRLVHIGR